MPFVRKTNPEGSQSPTDTRKLFIGRTGELLFFVQNILKPDEPTHNIISIWGQGGVGKSTLLARFIDDARSAEFKDYCLTATVDELQTTPASIMEKFAAQLHMQGAFEKALKHYREALRTQQTEREMMQGTLVQRMPTFAGAAVEGVPFVGPLLGEGVKATAEHLLDKRYSVQKRKDVELLEDPVNALTQAFVDELNQLVDTRVLPGSGKVKNRRVIFFFDTFEQLAAEAAPWLLNYFLPADISSDVVLMIAGRDPIERSIPDDTKHWLPYIDNETIYWIPLNSFTEDETRAYLIKRNITDPERIAIIWQISQGLPLYLSLLTSNPRGKVDPTADVVANFLRWIPEKEQIKRQLALDASLFSLPFNQDDLAAFTSLSEKELPLLYSWLIAQPFVQSQDGRYSYHDLAREIFSRHLYQRSKKGYYTTRRALANHYQRLLEEIEVEEGKEFYSSEEWLELKLALVHQLLLLPDEVSHIKAIEHVLYVLEHREIEQVGEIARVLREMSHGQFTNQISPDARKLAEQLQQYIEAGRRNQERLTAATSLLETIIRKSPVATELLARIYRMRGEAYYRLKEYQQALADFNHALELDPSSASIYNWRGWAYRDLKEYQQAIADFNHTLELDPSNVFAYGSRGSAYYWLKEYQQALNDFDYALGLDPNSAWIYNWRGWAYYRLKEYQQALVDFNRTLELDPDHASAYEGRGWTYKYFKVYKRALSDFDRLAGLQTWGYLSRGSFHNALKQYQQALADYDRALELDPSNVSANEGRGWVYWGLKDYRQSLKDFDRALELDPSSAWAYCGRGWAYSDLREYQQAIADYDHALGLDSNYAYAYYGRGFTYLWLKDIKQAKADFIRSWELDPSFVRNGWLVQWTLMCQDKPDSDVVAQLEAIAAIDPQLDNAYNCRGTAQYLCKRFEEAIAELEQAIQLEPERCSAYFWKGMTCASLCSDEDALTAIQKALELELPPILLTPLRWFEQDRPDFYQKYVVPLMARYDLV